MGYFDANGPDEMAVFTIVNGQGVWSIASAISPRTVTFGQTGDIPDPGNYDGLGYDQIAVYRPSTGQFLVLEPNGTTETLNLGVGGSADLSSLVPVPGGYDNQAYFNSNQPQRTEAAVYDPIAGVFTILGPGSTVHLHRVRVPPRRHSGPRRLSWERVDSACRVPTQYRTVHRGRGGDHRDVWSVG